jgi:hypothetical protein
MLVFFSTRSFTTRRILILPVPSNMFRLDCSGAVVITNADRSHYVPLQNTSHPLSQHVRESKKETSWIKEMAHIT